MINGWLLFGLVTLLPLWLIVRAWARYALSRDSLSSAENVQMLVGLGLLSLSTLAWLGILAVMVGSDYSEAYKRVAIGIRPALLGLSNILVCFLALICSYVKIGSSPKTRPLRSALRACGWTEIFLWIFIALAVH
jgi:hypothetical protein